jgi:hypothetical protein
MSYFKCSHGEVYHPFGKLSHKRLLKEMMLASDPNYVQSIKIHSFPLTSQLSDLTGTEGDGKKEQKEEEGDEVFDEETIPKIPFVERNPHSEVTETYSRLCDDILSEIFKIQLSSQLVPCHPLPLSDLS